MITATQLAATDKDRLERNGTPLPGIEVRITDPEDPTTVLPPDTPGPAKRGGSARPGSGRGRRSREAVPRTLRGLPCDVRHRRRASRRPRRGDTGGPAQGCDVRDPLLPGSASGQRRPPRPVTPHHTPHTCRTSPAPLPHMSLNRRSRRPPPHVSSAEVEDGGHNKLRSEAVSLPQAHAAVLRGALDAIIQGDGGAMADYMSADVVVHFPGIVRSPAIITGSAR